MDLSAALPARAPLPFPPSPCGVAQRNPSAAGSLCAESFVRDFTKYYSAIGVPFTMSNVTHFETPAARYAAFSYAKSQAASANAIPGMPGLASTEAETNLTVGRTTNNNEKVWFRGISVQIIGGEERLARDVFRHSHLELNFGAKSAGYNLGRLEMFPGGSGLYGVSTDSFRQAALAGGDVQSGAMSNGLPVLENAFRFAHGVLWTPASAGDAYNTMTIDLVVDRVIAIEAEPARAAIAPADAQGFQGVTAHVIPTTGVRLELLVSLIGDVYGTEAIPGQVQGG